MDCVRFDRFVSLVKREERGTESEEDGGGRVRKKKKRGRRNE